MTSHRKRRRIESSSEQEEGPLVASRPTRLSPVPAAMSGSSTLPEHEHEAAGNTERSRSSPQPDQQQDAADVEQQGSAQVEEEDAELQERWRIWEDFQDEYFDIVEQLPLELQRNFQLMLEHGEQARASEQQLQESLLRYLSLARKEPYSGALAEEGYARRIAATEQPVQNGTNRSAVSTSTIPLDPLLEDRPASGAHTQRRDNNGSHRSTSVSSDEAVRNALLPATRQAGSATTQEDHNIDAEPAKVLRQLLGAINKHAKSAIRASDDKVALSNIAYEWVDRHIRRLDSDLMKHEESLSLGLRAGTLPSTDAREAQAYAIENAQAQYMQDPIGTAGGGKGNMHPQSNTYTVDISDDGHRTSKAANSKKLKKKKASGGDRTSQKARVTVSGPVNPLPKPPPGTAARVPGQPVYCFCDQVSYDQMVGCENDDCPREWFHLVCVGLTVPPKGTWYCIDCANELGIKYQ